MILSVHDTRPIATLPREFISCSIDLAQVLGKDWWSKEPTVDWNLLGSHQSSASAKPFDFTRKELIRLATSLGPVYLKIGGAKADHLSYFDRQRSKYNDSILTKQK